MPHIRENGRRKCKDYQDDWVGGAGEQNNGGLCQPHRPPRQVRCRGARHAPFRPWGRALSLGSAPEPHWNEFATGERGLDRGGVSAEPGLTRLGQGTQDSRCPVRLDFRRHLARFGHRTLSLARHFAAGGFEPQADSGDRLWDYCAEPLFFVEMGGKSGKNPHRRGCECAEAENKTLE